MNTVYSSYIAPSVPTDVTVEVLSSGEVQVGWSPPLNPSGFLVSYHVLITNIGNTYISLHSLCDLSYISPPNR